jgi:hypothetical protein
MTDLLRFVALRAPTRELPQDSIDLGTNSAFQKKLASSRGLIGKATIEASIWTERAAYSTTQTTVT